MPDLWRELRDLFDTDDGSLPEVHITNLSSADVPKGYEFIRAHSEIVTERPYFWSLSEQQEVSLDSVPNAAALVVRGDAEAFHCVFRVTVDGTPIPDLGVFVTPDSLLLDYRMGPEWNEAALTAFLRLLRELTRCAPGAKVSLEPWVIDDVQDRFRLAWERFRGA